MGYRGVKNHLMWPQKGYRFQGSCRKETPKTLGCFRWEGGDINMVGETYIPAPSIRIFPDTQI